MTDDDNNDMEVESILSSIKNILEEDETNRANMPSDNSNVENAHNDVVDEVLADEDGDVIDLSDDMRIDNDNNGFQNDNAIDDESPFGAAIEELDGADETTEQNQVVSDINELSATESFVQDIAEENLSEEDNKEEVWGDSGLMVEATEPEIAEPEPMSEPEVAITEVANPVVELMPEVEVEPEPMPEPEVAITEVANPVVEPMPEVENSESVIAESNENAIDASANIISNFAKIFSKNKEQSASEVVEPEKITEIGDGSRTLEGFVRDAVVRVIGDDIAKQWGDGAEYRSIAEEEIRRQVKSWVETNMSKTVEKIVKEEMERVIAKVSS